MLFEIFFIVTSRHFQGRFASLRPRSGLEDSGVMTYRKHRRPEIDSWPVVSCLSKVSHTSTIQCNYSLGWIRVYKDAPKHPGMCTMGILRRVTR